MLIKSNLNSISKEGGNVFGIIYFQHESMIFPEKNWNDFIVIILNWWSDALLKLIGNESISAELLFMDGPFSVKVNYLDDKTLKLYFINEDDIIGNAEVLIQDFIKDFLKEVNSLIRFINAKDWNDEEIDLLKKNYNNLYHSFKQLKKINT